MSERMGVSTWCGDAVQSLPPASGHFSEVGTSRIHPRVGMLETKTPSITSCSTWNDKNRLSRAVEQTAPTVPAVQDQSHRNVERARGALWASYALAFPNASFLCSNRCSFSVRTLWVTFLGVNSRLKPQTLKLCIQTNIDILFLLVLPPIQTNEFQMLKSTKNVHFWMIFLDVSCFFGNCGV